MCVCLSYCTTVRVCLSVCVCLSLTSFSYVCARACVRACVSACLPVGFSHSDLYFVLYTRVCARACVCVCVHARMFVCVCVCVSLRFTPSEIIKLWWFVPVLRYFNLNKRFLPNHGYPVVTSRFDLPHIINTSG